MTTAQIEQSIVSLLKIVEIDYNDLSPYQKSILLDELEYVVDNSDRHDSVAEESYNHGYRNGKVDGEYEALQDVEERLDKAFENGRNDGWEDGYNEGMKEAQEKFGR